MKLKTSIMALFAICVLLFFSCDWLFEDTNNENPPVTSNPDGIEIFPHGTLYTTPGKSQLGLGLCWLFADNAMLETHIKKTTGVNVSLSENHARFGIFGSRFGISSNDFSEGGNTSMTATYWLRGELGGPVLTENDYPYADNLNATTPNWKQNASRYGRVTSVQWLPNSRLEPMQDNTGYDIVFRNNIKEAITKHGSVAGSLYSSTSRLNNSPGGISYYYNDPNSYNNTNHIIQILGWNDNYPVDNFTNSPPGKGAWYVKNSTTGAKEHFHWVSYYQYIQTVRFVAGFNPTPLGNVYDYTPQTCLSQSWRPGGTTRYWANIFDCEDENAYLEEVIIRVHEDIAYTIYVSTGEFTKDAEEDRILLNNSFSNKVAELRVSESEQESKYPGFYTLKLSNSIQVGKKSFAIVVEGISLNSVAVRFFYVRTQEEENFTSNARESYTSNSAGVNKNWTDWHTNYGNFYIYGIITGSSGQSDRGRLVDRN